MIHNFRKFRILAWLSIRAIGYLVITWAAIFYLELNLRPPGFTGHSLIALAILPFGSYVLARDCRSRVFFSSLAASGPRRFWCCSPVTTMSFHCQTLKRRGGT